MPVAYPVGHHAALRVRLHALHDVVDLVALHRARSQPVIAVRAANPVRLHHAHPQTVGLADLLAHGQRREGVAIHQVAQVCELLQLVEVAQPVHIALRRVRP